MGHVEGSAGIFARLVDGEWADPQPSVLSFLAGDTDELDAQWPRAGTARDGVAHRRDSDLRTALHRPWPTPTARLGDPRRGPPSARVARARMDEGRRNLDDAVVVFWPTPCASDEKGSNRIGQRRRQLSEAILKWPTPTTQDAKNDGPPSQQVRNSPPLNAMVVTHPDGEPVDDAPAKSPLLNAVFVECLMGFVEGWTDV